MGYCVIDIFNANKNKFLDFAHIIYAFFSCHYNITLMFPPKKLNLHFFFKSSYLVTDVLSLESGV